MNPARGSNRRTGGANRVGHAPLATLGSALLGVLIGIYCPSGPAATLTATTSDKTGAPLADVVIYLEPAAGVPADLPAEPDAVVAQEGMQFVPYLTTIRVGTRVSFPNRDNMEHHVKSFSEAKPFELKIYSAGTPAPITFDKIGMVGLNCLLHDWMRGFIYVVDTPYFANTDRTGVATVVDLPEGKYEARAWHPDMSTYIAPLTQEITIGPGTTSIRFGFDFVPRKRKPPHPV